jgi:ElaB/YqjD/DUF883 family membrane-anchored ribosome-binding protein
MEANVAILSKSSPKNGPLPISREKQSTRTLHTKSYRRTGNPYRDTLLATKQKNNDGSEWEQAMKGMTDEVGMRTDEIRARFDDSLESGRKMFDQSVQSGRKLMNERPLIVLGATLAIGVIAGLLLGRKSRN